MADLFAALIKMAIVAATGSNIINLEIGLGGEGLDHGPMKPRYDMDMAGTHFGYGRNVDFTLKKCSIRYDVSGCIAY